MVPSWSFSKLVAALPVNPHPNPISIISQERAHSSHLLDDEPARYAMMYGKLHLLGLPSEVRDQIWQTVFDDITASLDEGDRAARPLIAYGGLSLACHQIHDEIAFFWPRTVVQQNRIQSFLQPNLASLIDFKKLVLEIPLHQNYEFYRGAAASLRVLAPVVRDLRLFFVGSDKFQILLSLDSCGLLGPNSRRVSQRLAIDGQRHSERQALFVALCNLSNLRSLVISNHNYPLLAGFVVANKPYLKHLHLQVDARTTVHKRLDLRSGGLTPLMIKPPQHSFPPVEILSISANASLNSLQIAGICTLNLRHLTWTVPDLSLQSAGGVTVNWHRDTKYLLQVLRNNSKQLHTLRICIQEAIYEGDDGAGTLMPGFHQHLEHLPIEVLELHVDSRSPWFGREILQFLPSTVRRLYITRELLDEDHILEDVDDRYMAHYSRSRQEPSTTYLYKYVHGFSADDCTQIGEDKYRTDFISMEGGNLGFIGYEYDSMKSTKFGNSQTRSASAEAIRAAMIMLNGRLLDRERNMHLKKYEGAKGIPPGRNAQDTKTCIEKASIAEKHGALWVYAPPSKREKDIAARDLEESTITKHPSLYFGNEEEAAKVFASEPCVDNEDILERLWPDDVAADEKDHWMTDYKAIEREEDGVSTGSSMRLGKVDTAAGHGWKKERMVHWIQNWTWYTSQTKYLDEPERFLAERA